MAPLEHGSIMAGRRRERTGQKSGIRLSDRIGGNLSIWLSRVARRRHTFDSMDLRRHLRVLWRFRGILAAGLVLAASLAALSVYRVELVHGRLHATFRKAEVYGSRSLLYLTQRGFAEGRILPPAEQDPLQADTAETLRRTLAREQRFAEPERFSTLAVLYARLLSSERLKATIPDVPPDARLTAAPLTTGNGFQRKILPLLAIRTRSTDPGVARRLNGDAIATLKAYVLRHQEASHIRLQDRVRLTVLNPPSAAVVVEPRPYTLAAVAFLLTLMLAVALAYAWETVYPAGRARRKAAPVGVTLVKASNGYEPGDVDGDHPAVAIVDQRERR
jgi:hypothetical protein